jgi:hypothetical protein
VELETYIQYEVFVLPTLNHPLLEAGRSSQPMQAMPTLGNRRSLVYSPIGGCPSKRLKPHAPRKGKLVLTRPESRHNTDAHHQFAVQLHHRAMHHREVQTPCACSSENFFRQAIAKLCCDPSWMCQPLARVRYSSSGTIIRS